MSSMDNMRIKVMLAEEVGVVGIRSEILEARRVYMNDSEKVFGRRIIVMVTIGVLKMAASNPTRVIA